MRVEDFIDEKGNEEERDVEEMLWLFRNDAAKHVWAEYWGPINFDKRDMEYQDPQNEKEHKTTITFLAN